MIFRYFLKEVIPQFLSTLIVFCSVIVISQLVKLSEVLIAFGLTVENVLLPFLYIILPFLTIIIPISFFFAVMIAFSRLSADGELTALLSNGFSLKRAAVPVLLIAVILYGVGTTCAMYLEAWGRREFVQFQYRKTQTEVDNMIKFRMQDGVFLADFIGYVIYAEKISEDRSKFQNVMLAPGQGKDTNFVLLAPKAEIKGSVEAGNLRMVFFNGRTNSTAVGEENSSVMNFQRAEIDLLTVFQKRIFGDDYAKDDYRSYPPSKLLSYIDNLEGKEDPKDIKNYWRSRFLLHFRLSNPFAVIGFAFFGMVLGIQGQRQSKNIGYIGTILTVMVSYVLTMGGKWMAEQGHAPAPLAAWVPHLITMFAGLFLLYQKNRLPSSENPIALHNLPWIGRKIF